MTNYNIEELDNLLKSMLSEKRYNHSIGVANLAKELASFNNVDENKAYVAGLLHDITKEKDDNWQNLCLLNNNDVDKVNMPFKVKHAYTAKYFLKNELNIDDEDILDAVYNHTICKSNKPLAKIVFIADKREVNRNINDDVVKTAKEDLDKGFKLMVEDVKRYLESKNVKTID